MSEGNTELLVHITAPSASADDTYYRALTAAYLDFVPVTSTVLSADQDPTSAIEREAPRDTAQHDLESLSGPKKSRNAPAEKRDLQKSWHTPPGLVPDSNPDSFVREARFTSPTRLFERILGSPGKSLRHTSPTSTRSSQLPATKGRPLRTEQLESNAHHEPGVPARLSQRQPGSRDNAIAHTSTVPASPEQSAGNTESPHPAGELDNAVVPSTRADSEPPAPKRRRSSLAPAGPRQLARSSTDTAVIRTQFQAPDKAPAKAIIRNSDPLIIRSPEPAVSCDHVHHDELITPKLAKLVKDLNNTKRFRPQKQSRQPDPFERGYWLVDCTGWDLSLKESAWQYLTDYISSGKAGWGVWCTRDEAFTWLRLYCWGAITVHAYFLVYLASNRQLLHTGCRWIDSEGNVCILMGPRGP